MQTRVAEAAHHQQVCTEAQRRCPSARLLLLDAHLPRSLTAIKGSHLDSNVLMRSIDNTTGSAGATRAHGQCRRCSTPRPQQPGAGWIGMPRGKRNWQLRVIKV